MAIGIVIMSVLFVVALVAPVDGPPDGSDVAAERAAAPPPRDVDQPAAPATGVTPSATGSSRTTSVLPRVTVVPASPSPSRRPARPPRAVPRSSAIQPVVAGAYRATGGGNFFIGELHVRNSSTTRQRWTATLSFPSRAGRFVTHWVDGVSQPTVTRDADRLVFSSSIDGGASLVLRMHFQWSDGVVGPERCDVNGVACRLS
ncbi:cellulose binding domain-containing protein [Plantactinospora sp. GCM10030261]|uniref:cellulose binding domain-containing protein n=1 Tax=Plantactinospora sp. GCM10030261 TaxID=3273420 RepID=UPI003612D8C5